MDNIQLKANLWKNDYKTEGDKRPHYNSSAKKPIEIPAGLYDVLEYVNVDSKDREYHTVVLKPHVEYTKPDRKPAESPAPAPSPEIDDGNELPF